MTTNARNTLIVTDYFTKWPQAYSNPDQEVIAVAEVLIQQSVSRFSMRLQIHSAQRTNFTCAVLKRSCQILKIEKTPNNGFTLTTEWREV